MSSAKKHTLLAAIDAFGAQLNTLPTEHVVRVRSSFLDLMEAAAAIPDDSVVADDPDRARARNLIAELVQDFVSGGVPESEASERAGVAARAFAAGLAAFDSPVSHQDV